MLVQEYYTAGLASFSRKTYDAGIRNFTNFCSKYNCEPTPVTQDTLCTYVAYLANNNYAFQTIKTYLAAVRFLQIDSTGAPPPTTEMHKLQLVLRGAQRTLSATRQEKPRLPITPHILRQLRALWGNGQAAHEFDTIMKWAACCIAFAGFFRLGELTAPTVEGHDPQRQLSFKDVAVDSGTDPQLICIHLRFSKTDQCGRGAYVYLGRTDNDLCPVAAMLAYLAIRGGDDGPLFRRANGTPLTTLWFVAEVRNSLSVLGLDQANYAGHRFRIGAATTAALAGIEDSTIQALGRWSSSAFLSYIRMPKEHLASVARRLTSLPAPTPRPAKNTW